MGRPATKQTLGAVLLFLRRGTTDVPARPQTRKPQRDAGFVQFSIGRPDTCVLKAKGATKVTANGQEYDFDRVR